MITLIIIGLIKKGKNYRLKFVTLMQIYLSKIFNQIGLVEKLWKTYLNISKCFKLNSTYFHNFLFFGFKLSYFAYLLKQVIFNQQNGKVFLVVYCYYGFPCIYYIQLSL